VRGGKLLSTCADEVDVGALLEDEAGGLNGIAKALDAGYSAGLHAAAVHEQGIELNSTVGGEKAAAAGVEGGVVFKDGDSGFDGVEGGAAKGKDFITGFESFADTLPMGCGGFGRDGPGTAVDEEGGIVGGWGGHLDMVAQRQ
jgi:hypothetical protein